MASLRAGRAARKGNGNIGAAVCVGVRRTRERCTARWKPVLRRPVGPKEFNLIRDSGTRALPPRLPEQPFFYLLPVFSEAYGRKDSPRLERRRLGCRLRHARSRPEELSRSLSSEGSRWE